MTLRQLAIFVLIMAILAWPTLKLIFWIRRSEMRMLWLVASIFLLLIAGALDGIVISMIMLPFYAFALWYVIWHGLER